MANLGVEAIPGTQSAGDGGETHCASHYDDFDALWR